MKYEELYNYTGQMGRYQWIVFALVFLFHVYTVDVIQVIFIGGDMPYWCYVSELEDLPYDDQKNVAIPSETQEDGSIEYSSCEMYAFNYSIYNESDFLSWNRSLMVTNSTEVVECEDWTYDQSTFESTIVCRFDLVCGQDYLNQLVTTILQIGCFVGGLASGFTSDRFGRKITMIVFCVIKIVGIAMSIFGHNYIVFTIGRFLVGVGATGYYLPGYVLVMEMVGPKYRSGLGCALQIAFSIGFMLQPIMAYFLRDDFSYQLAASSPVLLFPLVILLMPESPRWLIVNGRYNEALKLMKRICVVNGTKLPIDFDPRNIDKNEGVKRKNCSALLASRTMTIRTLVLDFSWVTCGLIYYALSVNVGTLMGNIYVNTFIAGAVETPAYIITFFLVNWKPLGRRWTGLIGLTGAGISGLVCVLLIMFTEANVPTTVLSMLGKACISVAYSVVYIFTAELYPTEVRQVGMGTGATASKIGNMVAPYFGAPLMRIWKPLPSLVCGVIGTLSGLSYLLLPETLGQPLLDTIDQVENFARHNDKEWRMRTLIDKVVDEE